MTTQEKILIIEKERYGNYKGRMLKPLLILHNNIRYAEKPLTLLQSIKKILGFNVSRKRILSDEQFLHFLEEQERENPKPKFEDFFNDKLLKNGRTTI